MAKKSFDRSAVGSGLRVSDVEEKFPHVVKELRRRGFVDHEIMTVAPGIIARQTSWRIGSGQFPTVDDCLVAMGYRSQ